MEETTDKEDNSSEEKIEVAGGWKNLNTHAYISRIVPREDNLFIEEYYSSTDTKIYFDDIEQTEIGYIQYSVQEQLKPLYGYTSRTWDDVAIGNRIVTGVLKTPIRNVDVMSYGENLKNPSLSEAFPDNNEISNNTEENSAPDAEWISSSTPGGSIQGAVTSQDTGSDDTDEQILQNNERSLYRQKLNFLGYDIEDGSFIYTLEEQIKAFQQRFDPDGTHYNGDYGELTFRVKNDIDAVYNAMLSGKDKIYIPGGSSLYPHYYKQEGYATITQKDGFFRILYDYNPTDEDGYMWYYVVSDDISSMECGYYCEELCSPGE